MRALVLAFLFGFVGCSANPVSVERFSYNESEVTAEFLRKLGFEKSEIGELDTVYSRIDEMCARKGYNVVLSNAMAAYDGSGDPYFSIRGSSSMDEPVRIERSYPLTTREGVAANRQLRLRIYLLRSEGEFVRAGFSVAYP